MTMVRGTPAAEARPRDRPYARPDWQDALQADTAEALPRPGTAEELATTLRTLIASPNLASKGWVTDQYDRYVGGNTALAMPDDAGVLRIDESTGRGVALATDANGRYTKLDPRTGAQLALAEAYRNVATSGAVPLAITDCLNFGSPEDPGPMWQLVEAIGGLAEACEAQQYVTERRLAVDHALQRQRRLPRDLHVGRSLSVERQHQVGRSRVSPDATQAQAHGTSVDSALRHDRVPDDVVARTCHASRAREHSARLSHSDQLEVLRAMLGMRRRKVPGERHLRVR